MSISKKEGVKYHKFVVLNMLLLENLDELQATTPQMKEYKDNLTGFCEELLNELSQTDAIQKTTYFSDISNKVDTVIRKNFDKNM